MPKNKFKICVVGDSGVGKSAFVNQFLTGSFSNNITPTIGIDFYMKSLYIGEKKVSFEIFDFSGEKGFRFLLPMYIKGASGILFMYDITRESSLNDVINWLQLFKACSNSEKREIFLLLVGGKLDLQGNRCVDKKEAVKIAKSNGFCDFIECSAKNGQNVELVFNKLAQKLFEKIKLNQFL